jgi:hypothetical protein
VKVSKPPEWRCAVAKKETATPISVKLKSAEVKDEISAALKDIASSKGITQGEALKFVIDTVRTYGELPAVTTKALNGFTAAVEGRLNGIDLKLARLLDVLQIPTSDATDEIEYGTTDDGLEEADEIPVMETRSPIQVKRGFKSGNRYAANRYE